jgi:hypothetical protein
MRFYVSDKQLGALRALQDLEAAKYDATRDPNVVHKFLPHAFVDMGVLILFQNHKPVSFSYKGVQLGAIDDSRQSPQDTQWIVAASSAFDDFAARVPNFTLCFEDWSSDGCARWQTCQVVMDFSVCE